MKPITDIEEARKLPTREAYDIRVLADGRKEVTFRELAAVELHEEAILAFSDADGKMKEICYDKQGAYKKALF